MSLHQSPDEEMRQLTETEHFQLYQLFEGIHASGDLLLHSSDPFLPMIKGDQTASMMHSWSAYGRSILDNAEARRKESQKETSNCQHK